MKNKDEKLTYKELSALCRKQEEYIKELEEKLIKPSDTESCEPAKPTYDELFRKIQSLSGKVYELEQENRALRYSLTKMYIKLEDAQAIAEIWEEECHKK